MSLFFKNFSIKLVIIPVISVTLIAGCSNFNKQTSNATKDSSNKKVVDINQPSSTGKSTSGTNTLPPNSNNASDKDSIKILLSNIMQLAKQGKIIDCEFAAKTTVIDDIEKKWGKPNKTDWVPSAKGMYATYTQHNVAFGFNKGSQIFEVRSFDDKIKKVSLFKVKEVFGKPAYDVKTGNQEIIGYIANDEFKMLFVFPEPTSNNPDPLLDHYSILYPRGTVNIMADDPGRQW
jgi:hypothetical protein